MDANASSLLNYAPNPTAGFAELIQALAATPHSVLGLTIWPGVALPFWAANSAAVLAAAVVLISGVALGAMVLVYAERKVAGHIQSRLGPMYVGWHGVLQSLADGLKLLAKEDLIPASANRALFSFAPVLVLVGAFAPFAALPLADGLVPAHFDLGLFYVLSFATLEVVGVIMAGYSSNSKWSLFGGMRLAAQMMAYELPLGLSALAIVMLAGTLSLPAIVDQQSALPFALQSPYAFLAFGIFTISALANTKRAPFDLPEAESELVSGFHTEYSGMRFGIFFLSEYGAMTMISALASILFLGGPNFPFNATGMPALGLAQLGAKTFLLLFFMIWLRWTLPRVRIDQVLYLCLKVLLPMSLVCMIGAGVQTVTGTAWAHWAVAAALVAGSFLLARRAPRPALA